MSLDKRFLCSIKRSAPTPVGAIDLSNKEVIYSSGLAEDILGYTKDELSQFVENDFIDIIHPDDHQKNAEILEKLRNSKDGEVVTSILRVKAANGEYLHFQMNDMVYEWDAEGNPTKFSTVIQDVTKQSVLSDKLEKAAKTIASIRHKNSHELRAPVATIMGIVDLISKEDFQNEYQKELIVHLGETIKKLDEIIHQINDESGS